MWNLFCFCLFCRPCRNSNLLPRLAAVGGALLAILTDCQQLKTNKYFNYDYLVPTEAASLRAGLPEWGRVCYSNVWRKQANRALTPKL